MPVVTVESVEALARVQSLSGRLPREKDPVERERLAKDLAAARVAYVLAREAAKLPDELPPDTRARLAEVLAGHLLRVAEGDTSSALRRARKVAAAAAAANAAA